MKEKIIQKVRVGGSQKGEVTNLVVTIPINSGIEPGDYVKIEKVDV